LIAAGSVGLGLGALLGWTLAAPTGAPPLVTVAVNPSRPPILPQQPPQQPEEKARASGSAGAMPTQVNPPPTTPREVELEARIKALERELAAERSDSQDAMGTPLTAPANLGDQYRQAGLLAAVNAACRHLDPALQVTSVDCTEYPCIVYGKGLSAADAKAFEQSPSLKSYSANGRTRFSSTSDGDFAFTALPHDDANPEDNRDKRLTTRVNQMFVESRPH